MHEYSLVSDLIDTLTIEFDKAHISHIEQIELQSGINISEDILRQAFTLYSTGTSLEGANLVVEPASVVCYCECGTKRTYAADQLPGHFWICPRCESVWSTRTVPDLKVLEIITKH